MKNNVNLLLHGKKHSSKQVVPKAYTLEKMFFATATFKGLSAFSFLTELKKRVV